MNCEYSMKFLKKMCFKIILKVRKKQGCTHSIENRLLKKSQGERVGGGGFDSPGILWLTASFAQAIMFSVVKSISAREVRREKRGYKTFSSSPSFTQYWDH